MNIEFSLALPILSLLAAVSLSAQNPDQPAPPAPVSPILDKDYSYSFWQNSWRKRAGENFKDILCYETGHFGFALDIHDLKHPKLGAIAGESSLLQTLQSGASRLDNLPPAELQIELDHGGKTYRMVSCKAAESTDTRHLESVRMWESGRIAQHFDITDLIFKDDQGSELACTSALDLVVWPRSLTLNASLTPAYRYLDGPLTGVVGDGRCIIAQPEDIPHQDAIDPALLTVETWIKMPEQIAKSNFGWVLCKNRNENTEGNFGFLLKNGRFSATMNLGGGAQNRHELTAQEYSVSDKWHHLALTYDGKAMSFYLDGKLEESKVIGKPRVPGKEALRIGKRADNSGAPVKGIYDQTRIWNRSLTAQQIKQHAQRPHQIRNRQGLVLEHNYGNQYQLPAWQDATLRLSLKTGSQPLISEKKIPGLWPLGQEHRVTLTRDFAAKEATDVTLNLTTADQKTQPVPFDPSKNCHFIEIPKIPRNWTGDNTGLRQYDELTLTLQNPGTTAARVPFQFHLGNPAGITGLCPILCYEDGTPTGIPVQLSKNWHHPTLGAYFRPYMILPAKPGKTTYKLRIAYAFYGTLPSASHSQLSLVGWGSNTRWDQLAIGSWGETICFDAEMGPTEVAITDVRGLMLRNGKDGKPWGWTDAGWGGDWLGLRDTTGNKLVFSEMKVAYLAQGPCLTDVHYDSYYGHDHVVDLKAKIHTLRTDDYARTFSVLDYTFLKPITTKNSSFFRVGGKPKIHTPVIAYGNKDGLIAEIQVPADAKKDSLLVDQLTLTGEGPWWVSFAGSKPTGDRDWGTASRALIIRSYQVSLGGKIHSNPTISLPVVGEHPDGEKGVDLFLVPPKGVAEFKAQDHIRLDIEWITPPRIADDYYGPNETFRQHLTANPRSWKTVHREAKGNDLQVKVTGGTVLRNYPLMIQAASPAEPKVAFEITGGVGYVPVRFEGLSSPDGLALYQVIDGAEVMLDQSAYGNDFWQTDYDTESDSFKMSFNLPLDGLEKSKWVFRPVKSQ
jgi:hypothetical protein